LTVNCSDKPFDVRVKQSDDPSVVINSNDHHDDAGSDHDDTARERM
jgi:hypothetical protein